jgi:hypothetical protein
MKQKITDSDASFYFTFDLQKAASAQVRESVMLVWFTTSYKTDSLTDNC